MSTDDQLVRDRLVTLLDQRWLRPVMTVVAGAGFGKTTALSAALDADGEGVRSEMVAVPAGSGATELAAAMVRAWRFEAPRSGSNEAAERLTAAWWAMAPTPVCTVVDDAQHLDAEGRNLLKQLVDGLPPNAHLVVASRVAILHDITPLIGEQDLRFTAAELAQLAAANGLVAEDLAEGSGWPAVAALLASAGPYGAGEGRRTGTGETVWQEVLAGLDPDHRRALALLALSGPADDRMVDALLGEAAENLVDELLETVPLTRWRRGQMEVHALWAEPALASLTTPIRRQAPAVVVRALLETGHSSAAFAVAVAQGLDTERDRVVRIVATDERRVPDPDTAARWLSAYEVRPDVLEVELLQGLSLRGRRPAEALDPLRRSAALARAHNEPALETLVLTLLGTVAFILQDAETGAAVSTRACELAASGQLGAATLVDLAQVIQLLRAGEADRALALVRAVDPEDARPLDGLRAFLVARSLCELGQAQECLDLLTTTTAPMAPYGFGVDVLQARCYWMLGDLDGVDALLLHRSTLAAADGRSDDAAVLHALRRLIANINGSSSELEAVGPHSSPFAVLLDGLADAIKEQYERPEAVPEILALGMALGGPGAAIPEIRHLLASVPAPLAAIELHGSPGAARRVTDALAAGESPSGSDVAAAVPLLPRRVLAQATAAWSAAGEPDQRPPWVSAFKGSNLAVLQRAFAEANRAEPAWSKGASHVVELAVLGPVEVRVDGKAIAGDLRRERVRALLWLLVLRRRVTRREASEVLWPDLTEVAAANNLRTTLSYVARLLAGSTGAAVIEVDRNALGLVNDGRLRVDAWLLQDELARGRRAERAGGIADALAAYRRAAACWRSDPVHEVVAAPWLEEPLAEIRADFVEAAVRAAELLVGRDDEAALDLSSRALAADGWSLRASDVAIRAQAGLGRDAGARQALVRYRSILDELGLDNTELGPLAALVAHVSLGRRPID